MIAVCPEETCPEQVKEYDNALFKTNALIKILELSILVQNSSKLDIQISVQVCYPFYVLCKCFTLAMSS